MTEHTQNPDLEECIRKQMDFVELETSLDVYVTALEKADNLDYDEEPEEDLQEILYTNIKKAYFELYKGVRLGLQDYYRQKEDIVDFSVTELNPNDISSVEDMYIWVQKPAELETPKENLEQNNIEGLHLDVVVQDETTYNIKNIGYDYKHLEGGYIYI